MKRTAQNLFRGSISFSLLVLTAGLLAPRLAQAGDFTFEIPQLLGDYFSGGTRDVVLDLGMEFAEIESASLQLSGTQDLGSYSDLNFPGTFPLSAGIYASYQLSETITSVYVDRILPNVNGSFQFDEQFQVGCCGAELDFTPWLDGIAEFQLSAYAPFLIATTFVNSLPSVNIDSARLVIQGQPKLDSFMVDGDFNRDGNVDGNDLDDPLEGWEARFGNDLNGADFLMWQKEFGNGGAHGVGAKPQAAVPEPATLLLLLLTMAVLANVARR